GRAARAERDLPRPRRAPRAGPGADERGYRMSDGTFVEAMEDAIRKPVVLSVDGLQRLVVPSGWAESRREVQHVGAMIVGTLTSFADYVRSDIDAGSRHMTSFVHVEDPGRVAYKTP